MKPKDKTQKVHGAIIRYAANKHEDLDALVIDQDGTQVEIKFPPHTARYIREIAGEGAEVEIVYEVKPHPPHDPQKGQEKLKLVSIENKDSHRKFEVDSVKPPHPLESGKMEEFTIHAPQFTRGGKHDEITGVIFEDKYIHLHPDEYDLEPEALAGARTLQIKAKKRVENAGFVNAKGRAVYHAHSVAIDKRQPA